MSDSSADETPEQLGTISHATYPSSQIGAMMVGGVTGVMLVENGCLYIDAVTPTGSDRIGVALRDGVRIVSLSSSMLETSVGTYVLGETKSFGGGSVNTDDSDRLANIPDCYADARILKVFRLN